MKKRFPHTYVIIFYIIILSAILTWIVPGGEFERREVDINGTAREIVIKESFHGVDSKPQTWQLFAALFNGFIERADIIGFILIIGGSFWILNKTNALKYGIKSFLERRKFLEKYKIFRFIGIDRLIIGFIMLVFSLFGASFGMSEETIAFTIIFVPLSISMGYDSIVGVSMCFIAAALGFAGAFLNPFTVGIAQGIAELPTFSGIEYRLLCWIIINVVGISYILVYSDRLKKKKIISSVNDEDKVWKIENSNSFEVKYVNTIRKLYYVYGIISIIMIFLSYLYPYTNIEFQNADIRIPLIPLLSTLYIVLNLFVLKRSNHYFILNLLIFTILFLIVGVLGYGWYIMEIATLFLVFGLLVGISMNYSPNTIAKEFINGVKDISSAALVVGLAGGILIILRDGRVIDTILYYASNLLQGSGKIASISIMYLIQTFINIFIPSGSAQAALTMPIMAPFSDLINISRQTAVLVFQFGDGFTNMITPTSPVLIGVLGMAKIPYNKWFKWALPFVCVLIITGFLLLLPPLFFNINGF
ncbi:YfcC family protein [Bacteroidota bacterium]